MSPIQIALLLLAVVGVWAVVELALTLRKTRTVVDSLDKTVSDLNNTLAEAQPAVSAATFNLIFFIIGLGIIFVFEAVKRKAEHKKLSPLVADDAVESDDEDDE